VDTVIRPCLEPAGDQRRIEIVTRLRVDARLYHPVVVKTRPKGRRPVWGPRIPTPQHHVYWPVSWQQSRAWVYGRRRAFRSQQLRCRWAVSGPQLPVQVFIVEMAGDEEPWCLVTSAPDLSAAQVVDASTARFRQESGFRDHKPRLGMEECRAWTKEPILPTFQVQRIALTLVHVLHARLDQAWGAGTWWPKPEWNPRTADTAMRSRRICWRVRLT